MTQQRPNILAVDDEPDLEFMLTSSFREEIRSGHYRFLFAGDGLEALQILEKHPDILVVVSDIRMPQMDGLELLDELKQHHPLICPIIITAYNTMPHARLAMNRGAFDFLEKSGDHEDFRITLDKALQHAAKIRHNVKKRRQAEEALEQSERQYRLLAEKTGDGIAILQEQRLVFVNEALRSMLGDNIGVLRTLPPAPSLEKRGGALSSLHPERKHKCPSREGQGVGKTMPERPETPGSQSNSWQLRHSTQDGRELWLECCDTEIQWEGKPAVLLTVRDVTAHKVHELTLESANTQLQRENLALKGVVRTHERFGDLIGRSPAMQQVYDLILRTAENGRPILIYGESGTGKELVARTIRQIGPRSEGAFVPVNCGAIPENLFESEMFGYRKGAFTGASADKPGCFDKAHNGTLFLDEIGELSAASQVKLLRVLESGEYTPVGGTKVKRSNARILAATHRNLMEMVRAGNFRDDLFYRLHVIEITIPPLRERKDDLPLLIDFFMEHLTGSGQQKTLPQEILNSLYTHHWPGNIRELHNSLCRYVITGHLTFAGTPDAMREELSSATNDELQERSLKEAMKAHEKQLITQTLIRCRGDREKTAAALDIPARTLRAKIRTYQIIDPYQRSL